MLPAIPAPSAGAPAAIFVKGVANNGAAASVAQYVTFGHSFQIGELPAGGGLTVDFGSGSLPCQVDVKTAYADGSAAHAIVTALAPSVAAGSTVWGQFSVTSPVTAGNPLSFLTQLGSTALVLAIDPTTLPDWTASSAVVACTQAMGHPTLLRPATGNAGGFTFQCVVAGTTGTTEPAWPQTLGATVTDGGATWANTGLNVAASSVDLAALLRSATSDVWLSGDLAAQVRASAVVFGTLRVVVDATAYADGTLAFDVALANDVAGVITSGFSQNYANTYAYAASLTLNGQVAYQSPAIVHYLYENWTAQVGTLPHTVNSVQDTVLQVIHDPNDFIAAQAVQAYDTGLGVAPTSLSSVQSTVATPGFGEPMTNVDGIVSTYMPGVGARPDIGIDDIYVCWWFVTQNPVFYQLALECAKINGVIPWHLFNPSTSETLILDDAPAIYLFEERNAAYPVPGQWQMFYPTMTSGDGCWTLDPAHFPELVYLQYLTTGRRYLLDELNAVASWQLMDADPDAQSRNYGQGIIMTGTQVRASAWGLRNLNYTTYANPDGSRLKAFFRRILDNNLYWFLGQLGTYQAIQGPELFGYFPPVDYPGSVMPNFEECYLLSSITFSAQIGHPAARAICLWMSNYFTGMLLNGSNDPVSGLPPAQATTYDLQLFPYTATFPPSYSYGGWGSGNPPAQTWDAYETLEASQADSCVQNGQVVWASSALGSAGSYGDYSQLMYIGLTCLGNLGIEAANQARTVLTTQTASDGTTPPTLDDASWAGSGVTWRNVSRAPNASEVIFDAQPMIYVAPAQLNVRFGMLIGSVANDALTVMAQVGRVAAAGSITQNAGAHATGRIAVSAAGSVYTPTAQQLGTALQNIRGQVDAVLYGTS